MKRLNVIFFVTMAFSCIAMDKYPIEELAAQARQPSLYRCSQQLTPQEAALRGLRCIVCYGVFKKNTQKKPIRFCSYGHASHKACMVDVFDADGSCRFCFPEGESAV